MAPDRITAAPDPCRRCIVTIEPGPITAEELERRRHGCLLPLALDLALWAVAIGLGYLAFRLWGWAL